MARFYLTGHNSRGGQVKAAGSSNGQDCHLRGWDAGVEVIAKTMPMDNKRDQFIVYATRGSNGGTFRHELGRVIEMSDGRLCFMLSDELAEAYGTDYQTADIDSAR